MQVITKKKKSVGGGGADGLRMKSLDVFEQYNKETEIELVGEGTSGKGEANGRDGGVSTGNLANVR